MGPFDEKICERRCPSFERVNDKLLAQVFFDASSEVAFIESSELSMNFETLRDFRKLNILYRTSQFALRVH